MAVAMAVVLLIAGVSVVWGLSGNKSSPQASVTTPAASQAAAVSGPDCAAAWLAGAVTTSPAISAPTNLHPAAMADAVWMAACNVRRESACRDHDLRELTRRLDSISPPPNTSRWTLKVGLPLGCQLAADSTWEWSSGGLVAQRAYLPAADKKEAASVPAGHDKPAKPGAGKSALAKAEVPKAGTAKAEPAKAPAAGAAATARAPAAGGSPAPSAPKADAKPPAGDRPATVSTPGAPGAAGGGAGDVVP
jgi:hypothetical protein